jgi:shikimate kinase
MGKLPNRIALIGYMGSGKSKLGRKLARKLDYLFLDLDGIIEVQNAQSIPDIIKEKGEIFFRKLERKTLHEVLEKYRGEQYVLALGGGTPCYYDNMEVVNNSCLSVYLYGAAGMLAARLLANRGERPLIAHVADADLPEFVAKHLFERQYFYGMAHLQMPINNATPENLIQIINSTYG